MVREVHEETGLTAEVGETARVYSAHLPGVWRQGRRVDAHALRIVYDGWVPVDAPEPRVVEVDGSTAEAAWLPLERRARRHRARWRPWCWRRWPTTGRSASSGSRRTPWWCATTHVLLTRISERGFHSGSWTLPGGGVDHGESPRAALEREVHEECGVAVHGRRPARRPRRALRRAPRPSGRTEDFHAVHLVFEAAVPDDAEPRVVEVDGTTDAVAWVPLADVESGALDVLDVVRHALAVRSARPPARSV